ncbi:UDP-glucose 4-epimerase [Alicyclobacillus cellulosilyticus]|uniref:UDP-glucose 4-epimerase n=1 Tax=Alicyclobacillus cellulosilyticus TaxID=1003997 RepID=A0A917KB40_9BACL|nr:NAD-dependent epimerase/dehydratase family protein [Alicyclobacillus cellulosilyticus]GGJ06548.1 UDP-glucose 4-epimerase [Alicyclobacillus cellulosilyticus]
MDILVTGGAGFLGSHLTDRLLAAGHRVTVLDDFSSGRLAFLTRALRHPQFRLVEGSVLNERLVAQLVRDHDAVFHFAAVLGVRCCVEDPVRVLEGNATGTRHVAAACHEFGRKLVFASTSEVYGKNPSVPFAEDADRVLGPATVHRWCYATAKALGEHLCFGYAKRGLRVTVLRYFNVYGPRAVATPYAGVIPVMIARALAGRPVVVHGDGSQTRCFTHVADAVRATEAALSPAADGMAINVGGREEVSIRRLAETIVRLSGSASPIIHVSYEAAFGPGFEDTPRRVPDVTRLGAVLGCAPAVPLSQGLTDTIAWHRAQAEEGSRDAV